MRISSLYNSNAMLAQSAYQRNRVAKLMEQLSTQSASTSRQMTR
jgi:hypothetical protein